MEDSSVTVATSKAFTSYNDKTSYGNTNGNRTIVQATSSSFNYYDNVPNLVKDESFGRYELVSDDPLTVRYTIDADATWSDAVPVDAADLLLAWAANSGALNTPDFDDSAYVDQESGRYKDNFPDDVVFFDGSTSDGLQYVAAIPEIGDDGRSLTLTYDRFFVDWPLVLDVGKPAHIVAKKALGLDDDEEAKQALIDAIQERDETTLAPLARFWNSGFNLEGMPEDPELLVSNGPYTITDFVAHEQLTLTANPNYRGDHQPSIETIVVRFIDDPLSQVQALKDGEVDVIAPQASADVTQALLDVSGVTVVSGFEGSYEHLDLRFRNGKTGLFADPRVREAFLSVVPRQRILEELVIPVQEDAQLRSSHLFIPGAPGYEDSVAGNGSSEHATVDVQRARELIADSAVTDLTVCILYDPANPRRHTEFELIQQSAARAGFEVTDCSSPDWKNLLGTPGTYDAALFAWEASNLSVAGAHAIFGSGAKNNHTEYSNADVDKLFDQLEVTSEPVRQVGIRQSIDRLLWADAYGVPLYQFPAIVAFDDDVSGVLPSPLSPGVLWNLWDWKPVPTS